MGVNEDLEECLLNSVTRVSQLKEIIEKINMLQTFLIVKQDSTKRSVVKFVTTLKAKITALEQDLQANIDQCLEYRSNYLDGVKTELNDHIILIGNLTMEMRKIIKKEKKDPVCVASLVKAFRSMLSDAYDINLEEAASLDFQPCLSLADLTTDFLGKLHTTFQEYNEEKAPDSSSVCKTSNHQTRNENQIVEKTPENKKFRIVSIDKLSTRKANRLRRPNLLTRQLLASTDGSSVNSLDISDTQNEVNMKPPAVKKLSVETELSESSDVDVKEFTKQRPLLKTEVSEETSSCETSHCDVEKHSEEPQLSRTLDQDVIVKSDCCVNQTDLILSEELVNSELWLKADTVNTVSADITHKDSPSASCCEDKVHELTDQQKDETASNHLNVDTVKKQTVCEKDLAGNLAASYSRKPVTQEPVMVSDAVSFDVSCSHEEEKLKLSSEINSDKEHMLSVVEKEASCNREAVMVSEAVQVSLEVPDSHEQEKIELSSEISSDNQHMMSPSQRQRVRQDRNTEEQRIETDREKRSRIEFQTAGLKKYIKNMLGTETKKDRSEKAGVSCIESFYRAYPGKDIPATCIVKFGKCGQGPGDCLFFPIGVTVNKEGNFIVADTGNHLVKMFSRSGTFLFDIGKQLCPKLKRPSAVIVNSKDEIFVKDDVCIYSFSADGWTLRRFGVNLLYAPYGLDITLDGRLVVLDVGKQQIVYMSQDGESVSTTMYQPLRPPPQGSKCRFIAVNKKHLIVSDLGHSNVYITDLNGHSISSFGHYGCNNGQFREPSGVTVDHSGNILIGDSKNNRIQIFDSNGVFRCNVEFPEPIIRPSGIHFTRDGILVVVNFIEHQIRAYKLGCYTP